MSKKLLLLIVLVPIVATAGDIDPGAYRWSEDGSKGWVRKAVKFIDAGEIKIAQDIYVHTYSVVCVDGVKVLTTAKNSAISSTIIPGPCSGPATKEKNQRDEWHEERPVQEVIAPSGRVMVDW